ncbi:MAG: ATP-dependent RNA helicase [Marinilabiliales bacterium]|nr:MAG: ATP-dependent RNA helicase [Marinilabiliales bacterium]
MKFNELNLNPDVIEAISHMGFEKATPVQEMAIPKILDGSDLIACAQTGTGKTAAFILPTLDQISREHQKETSVLVIVPTRELAVQIDQQIQGFAYFTPVSSLAVYGGGDGQDWVQQKKALSMGADIIVATPGKLISHLANGYVKFDKLKHLILDEADRMLDMGFNDDIMKIISYLPVKRQSLLFSATMPPEIRHLAKNILNNPFEINIGLSKPAEGVLQAAYLVYDTQKIKLVKSLINNKDSLKSILIFSSTRKKVFDISIALRNKEYEVAAISSDLEQDKREDVLRSFRSKNTKVLVATDVLSRGIDIKEIDLVINFDVPGDAEDYVHRVGRTARADATGMALTLINEDDMYKFHKIEQLIETEIRKLPLPNELGEGPNWDPKFRPQKRGGFQKRGNSKNSGRKPDFNKNKNKGRKPFNKGNKKKD